ncbi:MAG TPA: hypothetical protein DCL45_09685 [Chloroflexi bacterium]|nr:hypothetical protein [Chloroflexota bacterium]
MDDLRDGTAADDADPDATVAGWFGHDSLSSVAYGPSDPCGHAGYAPVGHARFRPKPRHTATPSLPGLPVCRPDVWGLD